MNGGLLLIPFLLIRFVLLAILAPEGLRRAAHFAPLQGTERIAYYVYQATNISILFALFFLRIGMDASWWFCVGAACYLVGLCLCAAANVNYTSPDGKGLNTNGIYRFSRNPMYVAYFVCFVGMGLLTKSPVLLGIVLVFQISAHWIILAEERWCIAQFGEEYLRYMERVRRYI